MSKYNSRKTKIDGITFDSKRKFIGIELDDKYFEIAKQRTSEERNIPEQITLW